MGGLVWLTFMEINNKMLPPRTVAMWLLGKINKIFKHMFSVLCWQFYNLKWASNWNLPETREEGYVLKYFFKFYMKF